MSVTPVRTASSSLSTLTKTGARPVALGLSLLVLTGGHAAYESTAKTVAITVDGQRQLVRTHGATVGDALDKAHLTVGGHDLLAPAKATPVKDGSTVVLRRGREMALTVDGRTRKVWVTASSVDEALGQIGLRAQDALVSADRSRAIPLKGFSLDVRTLKDVQVLDAGKVRRASTHAVRVQDVLNELKVRVRKQDTLSVSATAFVRDGLVVQVTRFDGRLVSRDMPVSYDVQRRPDSSMYRGQTKVLRPGRVGAVHQVFRVNFKNGKLIARHLTSSVRTAQPVAKIVAYGTKQRPDSVSGADGLNWSALARCESGGNPRAVSSNGMYRGLYQFSLSTWHGVGGQGDPIDWSSSEQTYRAKLLYKRSGRSPWPICGRYL